MIILMIEYLLLTLDFILWLPKYFKIGREIRSRIWGEKLCRLDKVFEVAKVITKVEGKSLKRERILILQIHAKRGSF